MPIYEYECKACGHRFEAIQKISDDPLTDCPQCQKKELKKLISAAGFRLKGGGWYETDFKKNKQKNLASEAKSTNKESSDAKKPTETTNAKSSDNKTTSAADKKSSGSADA